MVTWQVPVPAHAPEKPVKTEFGPGSAVRVTTVPSTNALLQVAPQSIPAGADVTVPEPLPERVTVRSKLASKSAVTDLAASMVTWQAPEPVQAPDQPTKADPGLGEGVRVTTVFGANPLTQASEEAPQLTAAGLDVTVPVPVPEVAAVSTFRAVPEVITRSLPPLTDVATKRPPAKATERHRLSDADVRLVQVKPSGLVITRSPEPLEDTATNTPLPDTTEAQALSAADVRMVQVMPSGLVITRLPTPLWATATNRLLPKVTAAQSLSAGEVRLVHVTPSGLVITRLPAPEGSPATATKSPLPKVTDLQLWLEAGVRSVQLMPSGLVITSLAATATKRPLAKVTEFHWLSGGLRIVQLMPSGLVITRSP